MQRITPLERAAAPARSRAILDEIVARRGEVGDMVGTMAHSPALLAGYLDLSRAMKRIKLPRALSEKVSIALQVWIGCSRCLASHTQAARAVGLDDTDITLAKQGTSTDSREAALITVALRILAEPSELSDDDVSELRAYGWTDRIITELVGLVVLNLLTGAFNRLVGITASGVEENGGSNPPA